MSSEVAEISGLISVDDLSGGWGGGRDGVVMLVVWRSGLSKTRSWVSLGEIRTSQRYF